MEIKEKPAHPFVVFICACFLAGTGQLINKQIKKASIVFILWVGCWLSVRYTSPAWLVVQLISAIESLIVARKLSKNYNEEEWNNFIYY